MIHANVDSETAPLEGVIIHTPGPEVENMTPENAERALYSDILNLSVVSREYDEFRNILKKVAHTYEVRDLLLDLLQIEEARNNLLEMICENESVVKIPPFLRAMTAADLTRQLIEGIPLEKDSLTNFLSHERYTLQPLHNFFFTRDTAICINNKIFIARLSTRAREREAIIMDAIFRNHPEFSATVINPLKSENHFKNVYLEGGDFVVARRDILLVGIGSRTTSQGVDFVIEHLKSESAIKHIIVQELPLTPESFIHLDMVFTILDTNLFMIYEPVILNQHDFQTVHIELDNGNVSAIREEKNIPEALEKLGVAGEYVPCGGNADVWIQEREQWHSGANFFAVGPGKLLGYSRNVHTLQALEAHNFKILKAKDILSGKSDPHQYPRYVAAIEGSELSRGGGGCRCMTLPVRRASST